MIAYLVTLVANTTRIVIALRLQRMPAEIGWLNPDQVHRFEGIFIYFGFLLLLFVVGENMSSDKTSGLFRQSFFPLLVYYATMLGIPLANGAYRQGTDFWEHALFVLLIPLALILPLAAFRLRRQLRFLGLTKKGFINATQRHEVAPSQGASRFKVLTWASEVKK